jgi:hypothetical protein
MASNRNVILLGAGASAEASIPMLNGFVDRMVDISLRGKSKRGALTPADKDIFEDVRTIRDSLDDYHGRAAFNDRNIEDILSILALAANSGRARERKQLGALVKAIARTIDLECSVPISKFNQDKQPTSLGTYGAFWRHLINHCCVEDELPAVVTLNYDLVLERALVAALVGSTWNPYDKTLPYTSVKIFYHCATVSDAVYSIRGANFSNRGDNNHSGYVLEAREPKPGRQLKVTILKPHGSLNFPQKKTESRDFQEPCEAPLLMPPVFNKMGEKALTGVWERALDCFRAAVNVVICGYSLPKTDMYMQYFLKAALGPNRDLSKITVFDPVLHKPIAAAAEMRERFGFVFSEQVRGRIDYEPNFSSKSDASGTFAALVHTLGNNSGDILFL